MKLDLYRQELQEIRGKIRPLMERQSQVLREIDRLESQQWIEANGVTREQVQTPDDTGEWFGVLDKFVDWLKKQENPKRFAEWNGRLYFTSELIAGRWERDPKGRIDDLTR